jgi:hypothetical protein
MDAPTSVAVVSGVSLSMVVAHQVALSVGLERVIEILKGVWPYWPFVPARSKEASVTAERFRCAAMILLSSAIGTTFCWAIRLNLLHTAHVRSGYIAAGLVASAGAAFWNHILDMMRAAKVDKESTTQAAVGHPLGHIPVATHG